MSLSFAVVDDRLRQPAATGTDVEDGFLPLPQRSHFAEDVLEDGFFLAFAVGHGEADLFVARQSRFQRQPAKILVSEMLEARQGLEASGHRRAGHRACPRWRARGIPASSAGKGGEEDNAGQGTGQGTFSFCVKPQ